jgi:uncharacterized membrane protein YuzA (DUF378 family)
MTHGSEAGRRRRLQLACVLALAVVGFAFRALAGDSVALQAIGYGIVGLAGVAGVSTLFYEIGRSEDDERERAEATPTPADPAAPEDPSPPPRLRRGSPSPRRRGAR